MTRTGDRLARVAAVTAEISRTLEAADHVDRRIARVLQLAGELVPYGRCGLLRLDGAAAAHIVSVPDQGEAARQIEARLHQLWRFLLGGAVLRDDPIAASTRLALPVVRDDAIAGLLLFERDGVKPYREHHVRVLSAVACQLGAYLNLIRSAPPDVSDSAGVEPAANGHGDTVPLRCPCCARHAGMPYRARTKAGVSSAVCLGSRCRACGHEWEQDVQTSWHEPHAVTSL